VIRHLAVAESWLLMQEKQIEMEDGVELQQKQM